MALNYILCCHAAGTVGVSVGGSIGGIVFVVLGIIGCVVLVYCCQGSRQRITVTRAPSPPRSYTVTTVAVVTNN